MTATESVPADTETAVTVPADAAPLTAPERPDAAAPDADPATDADGRVAAVWAALNAEPGRSATAIGAAAGLNRMVAGKILNQLEGDGRARREPGVSDGSTRGRAADRWYPITADSPEPTDGADADAAAPDTDPATDTDILAADVAPVSDKEVLSAAIVSADPAPADEPTDEEDLIEEAAGQGSDGMDSELDSIPETDASEPVMGDPAWARAHAELTELVNLFGGVIMAKDEGNAVMALGCLEMAMTKVASAHRNARAALTGTAAPARAVSGARPGASSGAGTGGNVRTGGLRELVHAHLIEFPDKDFTPYEIGKVINRSSGAVANALDRLISLGDAVLSCERPRRFALAPTANPTPAAPDTDDDTVDGAGTDTNGD